MIKKKDTKSCWLTVSHSSFLDSWICSLAPSMPKKLWSNGKVKYNLTPEKVFGLQIENIRSIIVRGDGFSCTVQFQGRLLWWTIYFTALFNIGVSENRKKGNSDNYQWGRCIYIACVSGWILVIASVILFYSSRYQKLEEGKSDFRILKPRLTHLVSHVGTIV